MFAVHPHASNRYTTPNQYCLLLYCHFSSLKMRSRSEIYLFVDSERKYCDEQLFSYQSVILLAHTQYTHCHVPCVFLWKITYLPNAHMKCSTKRQRNHVSVMVIATFFLPTFVPEGEFVLFFVRYLVHVHENMFIYPSNFPSMRIYMWVIDFSIRFGRLACMLFFSLLQEIEQFFFLFKIVVTNHLKGFIVFHWTWCPKQWTTEFWLWRVRVPTAPKKSVVTSSFKPTVKLWYRISYVLKTKM